MCQRRKRLLIYGALSLFLIYLLTFSEFLEFLTIYTTFRKYRNKYIISTDWKSHGSASNSSLSSSLALKEDILWKQIEKYKNLKPNDTHLPNLHRNMTSLMTSMSGVNTSVQQSQHSTNIDFRYNRTEDQSQDAPAVEKVTNPHPFEYLINSPELCSHVPGELFMIAYVHTAPGHYRQRMLIRQTWGNTSYYDVQVRLIFLLGSHSASAINRSNSAIQQALYLEAQEYADIVQEDFLDSYHNLTYKGVAALKWITNYCSQAKFVLKTDDDIFVNSFSLIDRLKKLLSRTVSNGVAVIPTGVVDLRTVVAVIPTGVVYKPRHRRHDYDVITPTGVGVVPTSVTVVPTGVLMCLVWIGMQVMREGKWEVNVTEWKESTYPTYCSGSAFVMSTDVAINLHAISYHVPFFWVDDVYVTGLLPLKLGNIKHTQIESSYILGGVNLEKFTGPKSDMYLFSHGHNVNAVLPVWNRLVALHQGSE